MLKIFAILSLFFLATQLQAQIVYTIKADSVKLTGCDSSELIIENHTQGVPGFLFNTGRGRTQFTRGLIKINDSLYLIGADTLHLNPGTTVSGSTVFYVNRNFTGAARAKISGNTLASVSSTNAGYNSQLSHAVPGSVIHSYPDPFSARNAALDALSAGKISNAQVIILPGNQYAIGSDDSTKNGSLNGQSPNNGTVADIQFPQAVLLNDSSIASIMKNNVDMYFDIGTSLTYINSSYGIPCCYDRDTVSYHSNIYGHGTFAQVYGEVNSFIAVFAVIINRKSCIGFHAHRFIIQQWQGFLIGDFSIATIDADELESTESNVFNIGQEGSPLPITGSAANPPRMLTIRVDNVHYGKGQTPYPDSQDWWYFILLGNIQYIERTIVDINIGNLYLYSTNDAPLLYTNSNDPMYNLQMTVNIGNLVQRDSHLAYDVYFGGLIYNWGPGIAANNSITYNIKSANIDAPLLGMVNYCLVAGSVNNRFNLNVGNLVKNASAFKGGIFNLTSELSQSAGTEPLIFTITGNYKSYDSFPPIFAYNGWYSVPVPSRYIFSGRYETAVPGQPVAHFYASLGKILAFSDATLINDGTTPSILADTVCANFNYNCDPNPGSITIPVYIKNVHATSPPSSNVVQEGDSIKVVPDISSFFY